MKAADAAICPTMHAPPIEDLCTSLISKCAFARWGVLSDLPTTPILKLAKHVADRCSRSKDPKRYDDDEESNKEHNEDDAFEEWKVLGGKGVERDGECSDSHGHEGSLPDPGQLDVFWQAIESYLRLTRR